MRTRTYLESSTQPFYMPIEMRKRIYGKYWYEHEAYLPALEIAEEEKPKVKEIYQPVKRYEHEQLKGQTIYLQSKLNNHLDKKNKYSIWGGEG